MFLNSNGFTDEIVCIWFLETLEVLLENRPISSSTSSRLAIEILEVLLENRPISPSTSCTLAMERVLDRIDGDLSQIFYK